jgi:DNA-directed RNA polymerase subunit RPC12/RpoP
MTKKEDYFVCPNCKKKAISFYSMTKEWWCFRCGKFYPLSKFIDKHKHDWQIHVFSRYSFLDIFFGITEYKCEVCNKIIRTMPWQRSPNGDFSCWESLLGKEYYKKNGEDYYAHSPNEVK